MAAGRKTTFKFYVYEILDESGSVIYVGKGSNGRMHVSKRFVGGADCRMVAMFKRESDAYAYEVVRIAEVSQPVNKCPGGNGPRCQVVMAKKRNKDKAEKEMDLFGTRVYAARLVLEKIKTIKHLMSKVDHGLPIELLNTVRLADCTSLREVAYG